MTPPNLLSLAPFGRSGGAPPLWREHRIGLEAARLFRDPVFRGEGVQDGRGRPVLLIPGFLAGDASLATMTRWLRGTGHHTRKASMHANVDCSGRSVRRLEKRLEELVERQGQKAVVIGQSRGGNLARVVAGRRPDLVTGIVTLGSPHVDSLAIHPLVRLNILAVGALGTIGAPGFMKRSCLGGDCCTEFWEDHEKRLPRSVGFVSVYSKSDGVVDWHSCLAEGAKHVEVHASHIGMAVSAPTYRAIADAMISFRRRDERRARDSRLRAAA